LPNIKGSRGHSKSRKKRNVSENKNNDNYKKGVYTEALGSKKIQGIHLQKKIEIKKRE
jgi:hypothetical protein